MAEEFDFETLEKTYGGFVAPDFEITVGSAKIDSAKVPVTSLTVDLDAGEAASGCRFIIESMYDYETSSWDSTVFKNIEVDKPVTIKAGYVTKKEVFYGYVDDLTIEYPADSAPRLVVSGIDAKGFLMKQRGRTIKDNAKTAEVVKEILTACVDNSLAKSVEVGAIAEFLKPPRKNDKTADYKYLCDLAKNHGKVFYVDRGKIIFADFLEDSEVLIKLTMGVSLLGFSRSLSVGDQVGSVKIIGTDKDKKPVSGTATGANLPGFSGKEAKDLSSGVAATGIEEKSELVSTNEECAQLAQARLNAIALEMVRGKGKCIGLPELLPGRLISLDGMDDKCNGTYYLLRVTHDYSLDQGYFVSFDVRSPKSN